jgi:O-antigen ligase
VLALGALPFVPAEYIDRLGTIANIEADESGSAQTRWSDMRTAATLVAQHPLIGVGAGMNIFALNEARGSTWTEIHNVYLQLGLELGLPGLILFLVLYFKCMRNTGDVIRRSKQAPQLAPLLHLAEAIRVSLIAFAVAAMFHPTAYDFYFYYIAGLAIALRAVTDREEVRFGNKLSETR